jgi:hypothetical protein
MYTTARTVPLDLTTAPAAMPEPGTAGMWLDLWNGNVALAMGWASDDGRGIRYEYPDPYLLGLTDADLVLAVQEAGADVNVSGRYLLPAGLRARVEAALNPSAPC